MSDLKLPMDAPNGPLILHCDAARTHALVGVRGDRQSYLRSHLSVIESIAADRHVWYPTFNYDFLKTHHYDLAGDPSQVGAINEYARVNASAWRTDVPVFNFVGVGAVPIAPLADGEIVRPFDVTSVFGKCVAMDGVVMWYGAPFHTATILHLAESIATGPAYRFDKDFLGSVHADGRTKSVTLRYHVRPMDRLVAYDWDRIVTDAKAEGIIRQIGNSTLFWASAAVLVNFWVDRLSGDPLYLLDSASRQWIAPMLDRLGRRFEQSDFEGNTDER